MKHIGKQMQHLAFGTLQENKYFCKTKNKKTIKYD